MIQMINGVSRINGVDRKASDGPFEASPEIENRLVSLGVAEKVQSLAKDVEENNDIDGKTAESSDNTEPAFYVVGNRRCAVVGETGVKITYSTDTSVSELRAIAKDVDISFKVGTTKEEMVAMLDEYFGNSENALPDLTAMGPV